MAGWHIGVIGGTGHDTLAGLEDAQDIAVASAFGQPSAPVTRGRIGAVPITFLPRHGPGHSLGPDAIDYRANIDMLKRCGVTDVVAFSAVGAVREPLGPGDVVVVDQIMDQTSGRARSFFGAGVVAHVDLTEPTCARLSALLGKAAAAKGVTVHPGGCYVAVNGPNLPTRAELALYRQTGGDVFGMTAMPEAVLAREAELPYALVGVVSEFGHSASAEQPSGRLLEVLTRLARSLPVDRAPSALDRALDDAIVTPLADWDRALAVRLDAVAARYLGERATR
jgi:5'-methylthioadenosine phosphorylase